MIAWEPGPFFNIMASSNNQVVLRCCPPCLRSCFHEAEKNRQNDPRQMHLFCRFLHWSRSSGLTISGAGALTAIMDIKVVANKMKGFPQGIEGLLRVGHVADSCGQANELEQEECTGRFDPSRERDAVAGHTGSED